MGEHRQSCPKQPSWPGIRQQDGPNRLEHLQKIVPAPRDTSGHCPALGVMWRFIAGGNQPGLSSQRHQDPPPPETEMRGQNNSYLPHNWYWIALFPAGLSNPQRGEGGPGEDSCLASPHKQVFNASAFPALI